MGDRKKYNVSDSRLPAFTNAFRKMVDDSGGVSAMSEKTGISRPTINFWYNGQRTPDAENLIILSSKLGVSVDYLLGITAIPNRDSNVAAVCEYTGLSPNTVNFLHKVQDVSFGSTDMSVRVIDFLIKDAQAYSFNDSVHSSLLKLISVYLRLDTGERREIFTLNTDGAIEKPRRVTLPDGKVYISIPGNAVAFDSDLMEAVALAAVSQKLTELKDEQRKETGPDGKH